MAPLTKPSYRDKPIFKNLTIATACRLEGQWTDEAISRWVTQRSGKFTAEMNDHVTHVIFPKGPTQPLKENPRIRQALKRGVKACHVVTLDWLEDSIHKNKKLSETPYLLITLLKAERASELEQQKKARAAELEKRFVNTNLYHLYHDSTYFKYEVTITRENPEHGCEGQRYVLYLFESNAKPHLYWFAAKLYKKKGDSQPNFHRPSEWPQGFWTEYGKFRDFFRKKTGIDWDERLIRTDVADKSLFQYTPPVLGRPVGYVPEGCQRRSTPPPGDDGGQTGSSAMETKVTETATGEMNALSQTEYHVQTAIAIKSSASMIDQTQHAQVHGDDESPVTSTDVIMSDSIEQGLAPETTANTAITFDCDRPMTAIDYEESPVPYSQLTGNTDIAPTVYRQQYLEAMYVGQVTADTPLPLSLTAKPDNTDGRLGSAVDIAPTVYRQQYLEAIYVGQVTADTPLPLSLTAKPDNTDGRLGSAVDIAPTVYRQQYLEAMHGPMQATRALGQVMADTPLPLSLAAKPDNTDGRLGSAADIDMSEPGYLGRVAALEDNVKIEDLRNGDEEDKENMAQTDADDRMHAGEPVPDNMVDFVMA